MHNKQGLWGRAPPPRYSYPGPAHTGRNWPILTTFHHLLIMHAGLLSKAFSIASKVSVVFKSECGLMNYSLVNH